jgi:serine/threonine-protein kinase
VTKTGLVVGTPEYMSPEQLSGDKLDGRSDIYSLALVAFNMLTGTLPFPSDSQQESMIMRLTDRPKTLADMKPDRSWPADVQAVMDKALERDVTARYQNATDFGMALYNAIQRMPETIAAEAGTAMMGAVPPTRISAAAPVQNGNGGVNQGATIASPVPTNVALPVARDTAKTQNKSKVTLYATAAGVVIVLAVAAKLMMGGPKAGTADTSRAADSAARTTAVVPAGTGTTEFAKKDTVASRGDSPARSSTPSGNPTNGPAESTKPLSTQLTDLYTPADDKAQGATVLAAVDSLERRAKTGEERAYVAIVRAKVAAARDDLDGACTELKKAFPKVDAAGRGKLRSRAAASGDCQLPE